MSVRTTITGLGVVAVLIGGLFAPGAASVGPAAGTPAPAVPAPAATDIARTADITHASDAARAADFAGPATMSSGWGQQITRTKVIARADQMFRWSNGNDGSRPFGRNPNTNSFPFPDGSTGRPDCSGMVAWAWMLTTIPISHHYGSDRSITELINVADLRPGDVLATVDKGHVRMFHQWDQPGKTYWAYDFGGRGVGNGTMEHKVYRLDVVDGESAIHVGDSKKYRAARYLKITDGPSDSEPATGSATPATGSATPATDSGSATPAAGRLELGAAGPAVKELQRMLTDLGLYTGAIGGNFGPLTQAAVKKFQRANGLHADGWAGPITLAALRAATRRIDRSNGSSDSADPVGHLDHAEPRGAGAIGLWGWAADPDTPTTPVPVHLYVTTSDGNRVFRELSASFVRNDVADAYPRYGAEHGYEAVISGLPGGRAKVEAFGIDSSGTSDDYTALGVKYVDVPAGIGSSASPALSTAGQEPSAAGPAQAQPTPAASYSGGRLSAVQLTQLFYEAGFRDDRLVTIVAISLRESGGVPTAHNPDRSTGDNSYGLTQINMIDRLGVLMRARFDIENEDLFDPRTSARITFDIADEGRQDFHWWGPYNGRSPLFGTDKELPLARQAVALAQQQGLLGKPFDD